MRIAGIDCGTNSVRLLIAETRPDGTLLDIDRRLHLTRLGQGIDATGEFAPDALVRTLDAVADFADEIGQADVAKVRFVATSAARDASNRDAFFDGVRERLDVEPEIISGDEEAWLSYRGALYRLHGAVVPILVMDIGGGSTELVLGTSMDGVRRGLSMDIGSVRVRERFLHSDPPTGSEIEAAAEYVDGLLDDSGIDFSTVHTWAGVGGTVTSLAAIQLGLPAYDRERVHHSVMTRQEVIDLAGRLLSMPVAEVRALPTMQPMRADVICAGALIAARVARRVPVDLVVSESDILDGIVLGLADGAAS